MSEPDQETLVEMYRRMVRIRNFERSAYELYMSGKLPGFMHISIGQEATAVGACLALRESDYVASTHRGHGDTIAKGAAVESAMAELFGRATGICSAKGGSMHIADFGKNILGANGIVAAGLPISVGAALSCKKRGTEQVVLCFFGDGAFAAGPTHESMNFAGLWKLPLIFVRQNNQYAESTPRRDHQSPPEILDWAKSYGFPAVRVDGNDCVAVHTAISEAAARARAGEGPTFVESETYRWYGHNIGDPGTGRPQEEVEAWKGKDPIPRHRELLIRQGSAAEESLDRIDEEESARVEAAIVAAEEAPLPALTAALEDVYATEDLGALAIRGVRE